MNNISNWVFGSFFRTLGRVLLYVFLGFVISYFVGKSDMIKLPHFISDLFGINIVKADTVENYYLKSNNIFTQDLSDMGTALESYYVKMFNQNFYYFIESNDNNIYSYLTLYSEESGDYVLWILRSTSSYSSIDLSCNPDGSSNTTISGTCSINNNSITTSTMFRLYTTTPTSSLNFRSSRTLTPINGINVLNGYITQKNVSFLSNNEYCLLNSQSNGSNVPFTYNGVSYNCSSNIEQPDIDYDSILFDNDFYLFYDFNDISSFDIFSSYDFTSFTDFEKLVVVSIFNIFYLIFIFFSVYILIKVINKMFSWLF